MLDGMKYVDMGSIIMSVCMPKGNLLSHQAWGKTRGVDNNRYNIAYKRTERTLRQTVLVLKTSSMNTIIMPT